MSIKPFLTYRQQINELTRRKSLNITDTQKAERYLQDIGYFSLIGGYKELLRNPSTGRYLPNVTFDDIVALYEFDTEIRELFFHYICMIEKKLRNVISYEFCNVYGPMQTEYLNVNNYNASSSNAQRNVNRLIREMGGLIQSVNKYPYIEHQRNRHQNVPLWVLTNALTFGQISIMYSYMKPSLQHSISQNFNNITQRELRQYLKFLGLFRNVCAHHERFFAHKARVDIPDTLIHNKLGIPRTGNTYTKGKRDVFAVVISFKYFFASPHFLKFRKSLKNAIDAYLARTQSVTEAQLYEAMGFPPNWGKIGRYRRLR